jgi:glycosyltransferase involved in cell wall biosynthesis
MPTILRIINRLNVGGPTYNVAYLSRYIRADYETKVLAGYKEPDEANSEYILQDLNIPYQYVPGMHRSLNMKNDWRAYQFIKNEIERYRPDIVHTHAAKAGALGRLAAANAKKRPKILHTYHGNVFDGYFSPLKSKIFLSIEQYLCRKSDAIIAISETQKKDLVEKYHIAPAEKIHVVRLGFDLGKFTENMDSKRVSFRNEFNIDEDTIVVSIVGRLAPVKNHALFVDAVADLFKQEPAAKVKIFIVGDGEMFEPIVAQVKAYGLSYSVPAAENKNAQVIFTSWRKDIDTINAGSDIIALSSVNEGTPVSIIEALASGKAVICTDVGGIKDIMEDGVTGIISSQNREDFSNKLTGLVNDTTLRKSIAEKGRATTLQNYSYTRLVNDVERLYDKLLG